MRPELIAGKPILTVLSASQLEQVAAAAYTIVAAHDLAMGRGKRKPWEEQPELYRLEQIQCVRSHLSGEYSGARDAHEDWAERRRLAGWSWGPLRDLERRYHPSLLPWRALPVDLTAKAELYRASVLTFARSFAEGCAAAYCDGLESALADGYDADKHLRDVGRWPQRTD